MDWSDELLLAVPPVEPPAGFEDRVLDRIQRSRRRETPARRPVWAAAAAAAVLLLIGGGDGRGGGPVDRR